MNYVCLLRGINVGGNSKVSMKELKSILEAHGYKKVLTYINSGNLIFESLLSTLEIQVEIKQLILTHFSVNTQVLIIEQKKFKVIASQIPNYFQNDDKYKADIIFYYQNLNHELIDQLSFRVGIDDVIYLDDALIHGVKREHQTKSGLMKIVGTQVYQSITIRNVNTVRKIAELLRDYE
ncbi:MAG: hypothetical protein A2Y45_08110 [Tenericutes bacterium GWC2_34_14]|nr:MAG: hypothetical protein A2Z84_07105 [Tenericutes bacterium GWA2_35_7]OHE29861.1 MAG: hypothetical protein A2Y45_08110 [Tenericutes bacterium GWC2_34_14]OHE34840.1 MAG: hypothetical protein A2012_01720 [Tenericutes bacterium GWE2_34_108]OHE37299.1 MAG: hypothetical protein A2Y46_01290 [Tenericutes bacterium GWF1_35_14]OHE39568.1 MAG: hypothetical protein A2Y44_01570 [Tenericutes bacterium GWF2_35_184]OHE43164.1 MAG: hypothetical protein A3K26_03035 [Tenericutes bacterium RIFOXYA12_FULL_35_